MVKKNTYKTNKLFRYIVLTSIILMAIIMMFIVDQWTLPWAFDGQENDLDEYDFTEARKEMVEQLKQRSHPDEENISDLNVLKAMGKVERHFFVDPKSKKSAYRDIPLPIAEGQKISQPYVVARMTELLEVEQGDRVLEIGTGSGYQAAVLSELTEHVYSIEIRESLVDISKANLEDLSYINVKVKHDDGYFGWEEHAPFDAIIVTCAVNHIPPPLIKQLNDGGKLVIPLGDTRYYQMLVQITKVEEELKINNKGPVQFVPMVGEAELRG